MPFFLVTQTSLVEAQDEQQAAQKSIGRLRAGGEVSVAVKSDETTITHIMIAAVAEEPLAVSPFAAADAKRAAVAIADASLAAPETRKLILKRMLADGLALLGRRT
ncbi:hypothetical protein [Agrobacterium sp. fls2-241-TYG-188a]|uniref:hypothetical protein n=1 Tax=Agrobacterium sp. fls2-241-TYG-188a TaxID=3040275 RepID=UPI000DDF716E|nr:hypothetical protein [Agrobacterium sp. fls2-241-TYG-188a]